MKNRRLVVGNWKMNPGSPEEAKRIAAKVKRIAPTLEKTDVVICPPLPFIVACSSRKPVSHMSVGAQTVSRIADLGAHTGEVNAKMLKNLGVEYVIVGHSEQRAKGETDAFIAERALNILQVGMSPILCVGEISRDAEGVYLDTLAEQMKKSLAGIPVNSADDIIIAYEPVWAIGAKEAMSPDQVYEMSLFVKKVFADVFGVEAGTKVKVLYGGSVNFRNAADIITIGKVDGLLVGRESVNMPGFIELLKAVDACK